MRKFLEPIASDLEKMRSLAPEWSERFRQMGRADHPGMRGVSAPDDSAERAALRTDVLNMLTAYGDDPTLIAKAYRYGEAYMNDPGSVDTEQARAALRIVAHKGDAALYDRYMEHIKSAKTPEEYYSYFFALSAFRDPALTKRTFEFVLSPAVRNQDMNLIGAAI